MKQILLIIIMLCTVTAYTASYEECGKTDGITSSGTKATDGITASGIKATENHTVACDFLKFGTQVVIMGQTYTVEDRIGSSHPSKIDVFMESKEEALKFGRRQLEVEILEGDDV